MFDAYNLVEVLGAGFVGAFIGGVAVFFATMSVRNDAAVDRAGAARDLADANAARVAMQSARPLLALHPAYQAHTAQFEMIRDDEPFDCAPECRCHADDPDPNSIGQTEGIPDAVVPASTALVLVVDEPPVTADDLAPIGPDRLPGVRWWVWASAPLTVPLVLLVAAVVFAATLAWLGWDRFGQWRANRRQRRELAAVAGPAPVVEMELAHPAPAADYRPRHSAPAGRWWWSR